MRFLPTIGFKAICAIALFSAADPGIATSTAVASVPKFCETGWPVDAFYVEGIPVHAQAVQAEKEGRHSDAARLYECLNDLHSMQTKFYFAAAIAHLRAGNIVGAEVGFRNELALDPRSARAQMGLGVVLVQQGRRAEAEELLRTLQKRQKRCASKCERAAAIDRATEVLTRELG